MAQPQRAKRRRDPARQEHWRQVFRRWKRSGLTVRAFCGEHGISTSTFGYWRRLLRQGEQTTRPPRRTSKGAKRRQFLEVDLPWALAATGRGSAPDMIEVVLDAHTLIRVGPGVDRERLADLVRAVRCSSSC